MSTGEDYRGWTEDELGTSLLGDLIPEEHFENPLLAKLAGIWWANQGLDIEEDMGERLEEAFDLLTAEQKLKLASLIEASGAKEYKVDDSVGPVGVWPAPRELIVDEEGVVRGIVGSLHDVKEAAVNNDHVVEWLLDDFMDSIHAAGQRWKGDGFRASIADENDRRYMLKEKTRVEALRLERDPLTIPD